MNTIERTLKTVVVGVVVAFLVGLWVYGFQKVRGDSQQRLQVNKEGN